jgi:hypothetical protein
VPPAAISASCAAALGDAAAVQHQDAVAADDARQAMGQHQRRAPLHQQVERLLDGGLVLGVDRRQGLVQHQDRGVAQQRAGDGDALALAARQLHALLADDGGIALRQPGDEAVDVGGPRGRLDVGLAGVRPAHADVVLDRAVEEEGVLADDRDHRADLVERELPQVLPAQPHRAGLRVVEAQQQPHDRRLAAARRADDADPLAGLGAEVEPVMDGAPGAGIAEAHALEGDGGGERPVEPGGRRIGDQRLFVQDLVDALGRRHADHALVQDRAQLPHRPEDLDAEHQDDDERRQLHGARLDAEGADGQGRGRAAGDRTVGDAAGQRVGRQHPHGAPEEVARLDLQPVGARLALAERLQRGEALDRVQELGREGGIGLLALARLLDVERVPQGRREERDQRERQHDRGHRQVDEGDGRKDQDRRQQRDQELRQELAEIDLQLLHPVDQRQGQRARALAADRAGAEVGDAVVDGAAQLRLHAGRRGVGDDRPPVLEDAAQQHDAGDGEDRQQQGIEGPAEEHLADQPAEQAEARHAQRDRDEPDQHGASDTQTHPFGKGPQTRLEMHGGRPLRRTGAR